MQHGCRPIPATEPTVIMLPRRSAVTLSPADRSREALIAAAEAATGLSVRDLAMQFDSLGPSCEFGFVQRYCGAEPLSLVRFSSISLPNMVRGLDNGFAGLTDPGNLTVDGKVDWNIHDRTYQLSYHTFRLCREVEPTMLLRSELRRLGYLRDKYMADIAAGEKIFVRWRIHCDAQLTETDIEPLFEAVRRRGPAWLMYMVESDEVGLVEEVRPGLLRGHIDRLADHGEQAEPSMAGWLSVLVNASMLRRGQG
jgi:hypothetical protein